MHGNNPNNLEGQLPKTPEEIEAFRKHQEELKEAGQVLDAMESGENRTWSTESERHDGVDKTAKILSFPKKEAAPAIDEEIGLHPSDAEKLKTDPMGWINESLGKKNLDPHQAILGLSEAIDESNKKAA